MGKRSSSQEVERKLSYESFILVLQYQSVSIVSRDLVDGGRHLFWTALRSPNLIRMESLILASPIGSVTFYVCLLYRSFVL